MEHKEKDCTHVFSNGTEFGLFIETYCFNCTRYRNDHCKTLNRIYLAMLDEKAFPFSDLIEFEGIGGKRCRKFTTEPVKRIRENKPIDGQLQFAIGGDDDAGNRV